MTLSAMAAEEQEMERAMKAFEEDADQAKRFIKADVAGEVHEPDRTSRGRRLSADAWGASPGSGSGEVGRGLLVRGRWPVDRLGQLGCRHVDQPAPLDRRVRAVGTKRQPLHRLLLCIDDYEFLKAVLGVERHLLGRAVVGRDDLDHERRCRRVHPVVAPIRIVVSSTRTWSFSSRR
jgi:hypothetical protein